MKTIKFTPDLLSGRLSEDDAKRYFSRFGWFAFAFSIILSLSQTAIILPIRTFAPQLLQNHVVIELLSFVPIYAISFPLALLILAPLPTVKPVGEKLRVRDILCMLCICQALMFIGNLISSFIITAFQMSLGGVLLENPVASAVDRQPIWVTLLFTVLLAPIFEELFFRGAVCKKLLILGEGYAVVLSSAFFALCHGNFFQLFYAFTTGCFFGFIYVKTGKLLYTTVCHICVNFFGTVVISAITDMANIDEFLETMLITSENIVGVVAFMGYELLMLGVTIFGIALLLKNKRRIRFDSGLLPPPEGGRGVSCVFLNFGVAAAIALFALSFMGTLLV